jgi:hypothetical protein
MAKIITIIMVVVSAALVFASLAIVPYLVATAPSHPAGGGGGGGTSNDGDLRRIFAFDIHYDYNLGKTVTTTRQVKVAGDLQPNQSFWFLDPFSRDADEFYKQGIDKAPPEKVQEFFSKAEPYSRYNLIRLPEFLGGSRDDISSYRAFSAIAVSNSCANRYFSELYLLQDPCHGDRYRPWDGLAVSGPAAVGVYSHSLVESPKPIALPYLSLAVDDKGYIVAKRPDLSIMAWWDRGAGCRRRTLKTATGKCSQPHQNTQGTKFLSRQAWAGAGL